MSLEQAIMTLVVALLGTIGGVLVERKRQKWEREKEVSSATATIEGSRLANEAQRRKELDEASRDIREFLHKQVVELNETVDKIEAQQVTEREKWHEMLTVLSTKNLELELQHKRNLMHIDEMVEEAKIIDDQVIAFRARIASYEADALVMSARLDQCRRECEQLRQEAAVIK